MTAVSGIVGAIAGKKGADAQAGAARSAARVQENIFNQTRQDFAPARAAGNNALAALQYEIGIGSSPSEITRGPDGFMAAGMPFKSVSQARQYLRGQGISNYGGFTETPGYQFRFDEGQKAIERSAAARGGMNSGATMKALTRFGQNIAADEYNNYLNRLSSVAGAGQVATSQVAQAGQNYATGAGNALMAGGRARASGYEAISQGVNYGLSGPTRLAGNFFMGG